jgi:hypothetical protein
MHTLGSILCQLGSSGWHTNQAAHTQTRPHARTQSWPQAAIHRTLTMAMHGMRRVVRQLWGSLSCLLCPLCRLDLNKCGELSQQIVYLSKLTSLRELWLPGCALSVESDLQALRNLPRLVALGMDENSGWLLQEVDMWRESVEAQMQGYCCESCDRENEEEECRRPRRRR